MIKAHSSGAPPGGAIERRGRSLGEAAARPVEPGAALMLVMGELVQLMGATGALLTLHPAASGELRLLHVDRDLGEEQAEAMTTVLQTGTRERFEDGRAFWREGISGPHDAMYVMPVDRQEGHGRLVISLLFVRPDGAVRDNAERLYRERRPFAAGFFQLWQQNRLLRQRARSIESVLDQTAMGVILLDRGGHIVFANHTATEMLAAGDGIGRVSNSLRPTALMDGVNFQAAFAHAVGSDGAGQIRAPLLAFHRRAGPPLVAALLPAETPPVEPGDVAVAMHLVDPQIDTGKMLSPLCRLYGLSTVETNLVCHLAGGETIAAAAQAMHVKEQTARGYLKAIFVKTATRRQTELIALMLSSLIRMKRDVLQEALSLHRAPSAMAHV